MGLILDGAQPLLPTGTLSDATPAAPGTAAAGVATSSSRADHVHTPTTAAQAGALAASTLTTRGDLLRRGASAAERVALGVTGTILSSDGTDAAYQSLSTLGIVPTSRSVAGAPLSADVSTATIATALGLGAVTATGATAAAARAAIDAAAGPTARTTTPSLASSSGWTGSSYGGGTNGSVNTGSQRLDFAVNASGNGSVVTRSVTLATDWSLQARVVSMSDITATVQLILLANGATNFPSLGVSGAGGFECKYTPTTGAAITVRALTSALTGVRAALTAGTLWLRLRQIGGLVSYWYGIGTGTAEPTSWVMLASYAPPGTGDGEQTPGTINAQLVRTSSSGAQTASVDLISYRDLTL